MQTCFQASERELPKLEECARDLLTLEFFN
jgi:hypothetical protein